MKWLYLLIALVLLVVALRLLTPGTDRIGPASRIVSMLIAIVLVILAVIALNTTFPLFDLQLRRTWAGIIFAAVAVPVLYGMLARKLPPWMFLPLLLVFIIPQFNPSFFTLFHSFMHISFVYECFLRGIPPENPLMSGEPLRYMYGVHAVIAWVMKVVPISPPVAFAVLDGVTMLAFAIVVDRITYCLSAEPIYRVLSVTLALFGMDIFVDGPTPGIASALVGDRRFGAPISLMKFTGINTNQVGLLCFAIALLGMVRLASRAPGRVGSHAMIALATIAAAVLYQPAWMAIGAVAGAAAVAALVLRRDEFGRDAWIVLASLFVATAVATPVLFSVASGGNAADPAVRVFPGLHQLRINGKYWLMHILAPLALLIFARDRVMQVVRRIPVVCIALALSVVVLHAIYLLVYVRFNNEYKFLGFASVAMAPLGAITLQTLYERHRRTALAVTFLLLVPFMTDFTYVALSQNLTDPVFTAGRRVHHRQPDEDALYSWIWDHTEPRAVFVDSLLTVPPLGGRQLFVGLDVDRDPRMDLGTLHNGWLIDANMFQTSVIAVDPVKYALRKRLATELLLGDGPASDELIAGLLEATPVGRPLYVITRTPAQRLRLAGTPDAQIEFERAGRTVFRLEVPNLK
jgi:hypothetical protein